MVERRDRRFSGKQGSAQLDQDAKVHVVPPPPPPAAEVDEDFEVAEPATKRPSIRAHPIGGYNPHQSVSTRCLELWDQSGKGYLDEVEYNMRKRDSDGDGILSKVEVKAIVAELMADQKEYRLYWKASCWLLLMVALLALSNLGTSLAAGVLTKDTQADVQSGAILSKATGKIMSMQVISYTYGLEELSDDEFEERRALVESEMESDPEHEDHLHRRLGRRNGRNRKIAYDQGKIRERDLHDIAVQCDGVNTVSIERRWRNSVGGAGGDYSLTRDVDALCGPGTVVRRKGKKVKKTKKDKRTIDIKTALRKGNCKMCKKDDDLDDGMVVVEEQVTFKQSDGREVSFKCGRGGSCYGSGRTLLQGEGHPCHLHRDYAGAGECDEGLVCRDPLDHRARRGTGECTRLQSNALVGMACDVDLGVDACESGYTCHASDNDYAAAAGNGRTKIVARRQNVGVVAGTCVGIEQRAHRADTCDASLGDQACDGGYHCLGSNGVDLGGKGYGVCTNIPKNVRAGGVCDRSLGADSCRENYYCGEGGVGRSGRGLEVHVADEEVESEEARDAGQQRDLLAMMAGGGGGVMTSRSTGHGRCTRAVRVGGKCFDHESCGWNKNKGKPYQCVGLGMVNFGAVTLDGPVTGDRGKFGFCG
ncbi:hypothetical protein THAOC_16204 [Thalassiosira oceanica]|uniref:EF-hand domain-containing protein n=1 Tax=Thalassiosira oceanica TaxID=159749 RepID=K0SCS4_THAOC|nr:hypothetical protein THAOC_16204 [Thalassiosira oceanica]|eukprot:EJK63155.1 hypothetical protein THAOC_16204 [Thalassiosira oceanica]